MRFFIIIALFTCASLLAGCTEQAERPTEGYEKNFIRTVPGKGYFVIYRLYGALEPYFNQTWKLNDLVKGN